MLEQARANVDGFGWGRSPFVEMLGEARRSAMRELCRVAREVRTFRILDLARQRSRHLEPLMRKLDGDGFTTHLER
jgi:hypothetical protein